MSDSSANGEMSLKFVDVDLIDADKIALRGVQQDSERFQNLLASVKERGVRSSVDVRPTADGRFILVNGLQRYTAAKLAGIKSIPATIEDRTEDTAMTDQILLNLNTIPQSLAQVSEQLARVIARDPTKTVESIARSCGQTPDWVNQRLSLQKLTEKGMNALKKNKLSLMNAVSLARLPEKEQDDMLVHAKEEPAATFLPRIQERLREIKNEKNAGRDAGTLEWKPQQHSRSVKEIKDEFAIVCEGGKGESSILTMLAAEGIKVDAAVKAVVDKVVRWSLNVDAAAVQKQKSEYDAREATKKQREEERKAAREKAKAEKAKVEKTPEEILVSQV